MIDASGSVPASGVSRALGPTFTRLPLLQPALEVQHLVVVNSVAILSPGQVTIDVPEGIQTQAEAGDSWALTSRIKYGDVDLTVPVPVQVKWAGKTPVITVDSVKIPGLGTFSARVLLDRARYAGTWSHDEKGGHLFGVIERDGAEVEVNAMAKRTNRRGGSFRSAHQEAVSTCDSCGEEIVVPVDSSAGSHQDDVEDCPVCCHPMTIHVEIDPDGAAHVQGEHEEARHVDARPA